MNELNVLHVVLSCSHLSSNTQSRSSHNLSKVFENHGVVSMSKDVCTEY